MGDNCELPPPGYKPGQQTDLDSPESVERMRKCWQLLREGKVDFSNPPPWETGDSGPEEEQTE